MKRIVKEEQVRLFRAIIAKHPAVTLKGAEMITILLFLISATVFGQNIILVNEDVQNITVPAGIEVLHVSNDWFLASGNPALINSSVDIIEEGAVRLEDYSLVHLRTADDIASASAVGEVLFCRGKTALVRNNPNGNGLRAYEGVNLVEPLRVYSERAINPFRPSTLSNPAITDIVEAVNQDSLIATIQTYEDYVTRLCVTDQFYNSCVWTRDKLISYGLPAVVEDFNFTFYGNPYTSYNVVAEQPGLIEPEVIVIICGHLDSITMQSPYDSAPGADDNGSGSATVVEAARILSELNFRYTIRYLCFGAEELGLIGSDFYAQEAAANGDSIIAVVNLDMILFAPDSLRQLFVPYNTISEELAMNMQSITETYVPELELNVQYSPGTTYSDHASFWQQGFPAILGIEQGVNENPYYHQESDLLANYMEYFPFGTECAKAAIATVAVYADPLEEGIEHGQGNTGLIVSAGPVPAASTLTIRVGSSANTTLRLFDAAGREVSVTELQAGTTEYSLSVAGLPAGVYVLHGESGDLSDSHLIVIAR